MNGEPSQKEQESSSKTNKETATKLYDMQQLIDKAAEEVSDKTRALSKVEAELKALQKKFDVDKHKATEELQVCLSTGAARVSPVRH